MSYNQYDLANTSLVKTGNLTEMYIPLWWYSSGTELFSSLSSGSSFLGKGDTAAYTSNTSPQAKLYTVSANWNPNQKFAFEASIRGTTGYSALWDMTTNQIVSGSQISTTSGLIVVRSSSFTLTPGHTYGVTLWASSGSSYLAKASLIALLS